MCCLHGPEQSRLAAGLSAGRAGCNDHGGFLRFPESVLLAHIYADALAAKGFPTEVLPNLGNRELVSRRS